MPEQACSDDATGLYVQAHHFDNFEEFDQSVQGWATRFRQVDRGVPEVAFRHRMTAQINALDLTFSHGTFATGAAPRGQRTFGIPGGNQGCTWCEKDVNSLQILRFDAHEEFHSYTPSGFVARTLSIDETLLACVAEALGHSDFLARLNRSPDILTIKPRAMRRFWAVYDGRLSSTKQLQQIVEELVMLTEPACHGPSRVFPGNTARHVGKALEYITANARDAVTVADVCRATNTNYRTLDRAFLKHLGHGPKDSIMASRLSGVRTALREADPSMQVGDIAREWGFWHMGDFARLYRAEYAELPSETLGSVG
jgi:AraC-like DNA-binding protein